MLAAAPAVGHPGWRTDVAAPPRVRHYGGREPEPAIQVYDTAHPDLGPGALAIAPDGLRCAAAGSHGKVVVWDVDE
jgi:hypothetical protein